MSAPVPQRKPPESKRHRWRMAIAISLGNDPHTLFRSVFATIAINFEELPSFPRRREPRTWRVLRYPRQTWKVRPYGLAWAARHFRRLRRWNGRGRPTCLPRCHKGNHLNRNATIGAGQSQISLGNDPHTLFRSVLEATIAINFGERPVVPAKAGTSHLASAMVPPPNLERPALRIGVGSASFQAIGRWNGRGRPTCLPRCHKGNHLNRNATVGAWQSHISLGYDPHTLFRSVLEAAIAYQLWGMTRRSREGGNLAPGLTLSRFR